MKKYSSSRIIVIFLIVLFLLSACQGSVPAATSAANSTPAATETPVPTETPAATLTNTFTPTPDPFFSGTGTFKSGDGNKEVDLQFINNTDQLLLINWVNFDGKEEPFIQVGPQSSITQSTFSTHAWRVVDESGNVYAEIIATNEKLQVYEISADKHVAYQPTPLPAPTMGPDVPTTERAFADRPDDDPGMYQVHILYVIPADAEDRQIDLDGSISRSVEAANNWFLEQSGGSKIYFDTYQGQLDITFVKLDITNADFYDNTVAAYGSGNQIRNYMESTLDHMRILHPGKLYVSFFDIYQVYNSCADGPHPLEVTGRVTGHYPVATVLRDNSDCHNETFGVGNNFADMGIVHEIGHALGFESKCGKNPTSAENWAHTGDDVRDLMWAPAEGYSGPWWDVDHMLLDPGNDDYFKHNIPNCPDLARSIFLDPTPENPEVPADWPAEWRLPNQ